MFRSRAWHLPTVWTAVDSAACSMAPVVAGGADLYSVQEIPRGRFASVTGADLNDAGHVAGTAGAGGFFWSPQSGFVEIPAAAPFQGPNPVVPLALNNDDLVVGYFLRDFSFERAFSWSPRDPAMREIDVGFPAALQRGELVNDAGRIVIQTFGSGPPRTQNLVRGPDGTFRQLPDPRGGQPRGGGVLRGLTAAGDVVGQSYFGADGDRAVVWPAAGAPRRLADPPDFVSTDAYAMNAAGTAVGNGVTSAAAPVPRSTRALLWRPDGSVVDLGTLPGELHARAHDVNDAGEVVGASFTSTGATGGRAFLWTPADGMRDLNELLDATSEGWLLTGATRVNRGGQVLAAGLVDGRPAVALLTPVPEPAATAALLPVLAALLARRRASARPGSADKSLVLFPEANGH